MKLPSRNIREAKTITLMAQMYCRAHHMSAAGTAPCKECQGFIDYAFQRLEKCPFKDLKPACAECHIHCYQPEPRDLARKIMRYSGPRMLKTHPILALLHLWDQWRSQARIRAFKKTKKEP